MDPEKVTEHHVDRLDAISLYIEDKKYTVSPDEVTPETTLNEYLRQHMHLTGTKVMCQEGGCGTCIVAVTSVDPKTKQELVFSINSCLVSIFQCSGWKVNTIEGIGNAKNGYHPIQKTLATFNGSQCGFCSAGMIMNMYPLYLRGNLTMANVENSFGGNICRCTGYRAILAAFKSMAVDASVENIGKYPDIEDIRMCPKDFGGTGQCSLTCERNCHERETRRATCLVTADNAKWYKVFTISEILEIFRLNQNAVYMLVAGNTAQGVYKRTVPIQVYIDVTHVPELITYQLNGSNLTLGANMSLTDVMQLFYKLAAENTAFAFLKTMADHIDLVAHVPVRNIGTLAGNLTTKHDHHEFPSDIFLLLEAVGANMNIVGSAGTTITMKVADYITYDMNRKVIKNIVIPAIGAASKFQSYKIMPRAQNAHAMVNAAFVFNLSTSNTVNFARIVYGGINPTFIHAKSTEQYLSGKNLFDNATIQGAIKALQAELQPDAVLPDPSPEFRKGLAIALFYKCVLSMAPDNLLTPSHKSGAAKLVRGLSNGAQDYGTNESLYPVGKPINKLEALAQCSGAAEYIIDIPDRPEQLYGAFVLAEATPGSTIISTNTTDALNLKGVVKYYDKSSIPGINSISPKISNLDHDEELFCAGTVRYYFQPVGIIIADCQKTAEAGAALVKITYKMNDTLPLLTIREILKANAQDKIHPDETVVPSRTGTDIKHVIKGEFDIGPQYHYHMETQCCNAVPTEDGIDMYPASQWMDITQITAATCLGLHVNQINCTVRRLGGAYGAKISRNAFVSCAAAIAAYDLRKPVKIWMPFISNMNAIGKRFPCSMNYEIALNDKGIIQYVKNKFYIDYGAEGGNELVVGLAIALFLGPYISETFDVSAFTTRTDTPTGTWTRAPGSTEGISMLEAMMEHAAVASNLDPLQMRIDNLNLVKNPKLIEFVKELTTWANIDARKAEIETYNKANRWMKKGLSVVPMDYTMEVYGPFPVMVVIYQGDGSVGVRHSGVEMGQGINTKVAQTAAYALKVPIETVSVKPTNNFVGANAFPSGGSLTSEAVSFGTLKACETLAARLEAVKAGLPPGATYLQIVKTAYATGVDLNATYTFGSKDEANYQIYGVIAVEVLQDILTGNHILTRVDLLEDTGDSMNPYIDIGQVEGALAMGIGYWTTEEIIYKNTGELMTNRTWNYKPPGARDIPVQINVKFPKNNPNVVGVLNSKALAEPAFCLTICIPMAIRQAVASARRDADQNAEKWYKISGPTTVENVFLNSLHKVEQYTL